MDPASYKPLARGEFRLLQVVPAPLLADPIIRLETFSIDHPPLYVALSYTWGDDAETFGPVYCLPDGRGITLRKNVYTALLRCQTDLRMNNISYVWIDALCINQHDSIDKAAQIPIIDKIFDRADHVIVWMGVGTPPEEKALDRMTTLSKAIRSISHNNSTATWFQDLTILPKLFPSPNNLEFWHAFMEIIAKPWFNRTWVIQEACTRTSITLILGDSTSIAFQDFAEVIQAFRAVRSDGIVQLFNMKSWKPSTEAQRSLSRRMSLRYNYDLNRISEASARRIVDLVQRHFTDLLSAFSDLANLRALKMGAEELFTHYMFRAFRGRDCTYEEDRVYAMIGLMKPALRAGITVDFSRSVRDTYMNAARHWWLNDRELSFLHWIHSDHIDKVAQLWLPSWCLDFSFMENYPIVFAGMGSENAYNAGMGHHHALPGPSVAPSRAMSMPRHSQPLPLQLQDISPWRARTISFGHKGSLRVNAIHADTVTSIVPRTTFPYTSWRGFLEETPSQSDVVDVLRWLDDCANLSYNTLGEAFSESLWRTMVINKRALAKQSSHSTDVYFEDNRGPSYMAVHEAFRTDIGQMKLLRDDRHAYFEDLGTTLEYIFFATSGRHIGRASGSIRPGDEVVIFHGAKTPFLLRPLRGGSGLYKLVAEVYVHGLMQGEVFEPQSGAYMKQYTII